MLDFDEHTPESYPGSVRYLKSAYEQAAALHTVPQWQMHLELDGWDYILSPYEYQPLIEPNEIRLLRIFPFKDRIRFNGGVNLPRCELVHVNLDSSPSYMAISYAWGNLLEYSPIYLHDQQCLMVTNSLWAILNRFCSGDEILEVWADQVSVNQRDLVERAEQVKLMGRIFSQADFTNVWLGPSDESIDPAFALVEKLSSIDLSLTEVFDMVTTKDRNGLRSRLQSESIDCDDGASGWTAIENLSTKPWFTRLWTFQEFVLSKEVLFFCGSLICDDTELLRAFYAAQIILGRSTAGMSHTQSLLIARRKHAADKQDDLLELLWLIWRYCDYECTDPRDRVYALLTLQNPRVPCEVNVDYSASVAKVFQDTAKEIIKSTGSLKILARRRFGYLEDLPSWAPDWSCSGWLQHFLDDSDIRFSSSDDLQHALEESPNDVLLVKGKAVSRVAKVASHKFEEHLAEKSEGNLDAFLGSTTLIPQVLNALQNNPVKDGKRKREESGNWNWLLAKTITAGRLQWQNEHEFSADCGEDQLDVAAIVRKSRSTYGHSVDVAKCLGRSIAILGTQAYPIGLVPNYAREGDLICVINGSTTPLVLRRKAQHFELIGECYVHGIMYGEAVDWKQGGGETFVIR